MWVIFWYIYTKHFFSRKCVVSVSKINAFHWRKCTKTTVRMIIYSLHLLQVFQNCENALANAKMRKKWSFLSNMTQARVDASMSSISFTTPLPNVSFKLQLMQPSFGNCDLQSKLDFPSPRTLEMSEHLGPIQTISFPLQRKPFDQVQLHQLSFKGIIRGWKLIALFSMQALLWLQL